MNLPSLKSLIQRSTSTFRRFPVALVWVLVGSAFAMLLLHLPDNDREFHPEYLNILMSSYLGMLLFISIAVYLERTPSDKSVKIILQFAGFMAVISYYYFLPGHFMIISAVRFALFTIGLHLLLAFVPFMGHGEWNGFWQYNKILFLRILTAALYSSALFLGLALAILAVDQLFKTHLNEKVYGDLWIFIAGIFNTWFFLAGFPAHYQNLDGRKDYPKGLKLFTQYVLLPLITVYLLILYAYMFKIIFTSEWPVGWVTYLVLGFSIAGIFSLLLIHPIRNEADNRWMLVFSRFFYFALFPLIILLFLAIKRRINDYGITENRYFVLVLAGWLVFIATYFLLTKTRSIKLIPISLCFLAFLTSFGPWGVFSVSLHSQKKHLTDILVKTKMFSDGKIRISPDTISFDDQREISSVVEYLASVHGYQSLQPFFIQNLDSLMKPDSTNRRRQAYEEVNEILGLMNITYVKSYRTNDYEEKYIDLRSVTDRSISIAGYHYFISDYHANKEETKDTVCSSYTLGNRSILVCFDSKRNIISMNTKTYPALEFDVSSLIKLLQEKKYADHQKLKAEDMTLVSSNDHILVKMIFQSIHGNRDEGSIKLNRIQADVLIQFKDGRENE